MLAKEVRTALGTNNQAKRAAVMLAAGVEPICHTVPSGVSDQPMTEDETIIGAINRAKSVLENGLFTDGRITRNDVFRDAVIAALTQFQSPFYK